MSGVAGHGRSQSEFRPELDHGLLGERWTRRHLLARELIQPDVAICVVPLSGGVSCDVVAVSGPGINLVVKRALPKLRVDDEWLADAGRSITEGRALQLADGLVPDSVPEVVDLDESTLTLVLRRAPKSWTNWREDLLSGTVDPCCGRRLGERLGVWHRETAGPKVPVGIGDPDSFFELRIDPFFRTAAKRNPVLARRIDDVVDRLQATRHGLVHGDLSPKNVLNGADGQWVLDWETAHVGDQSFDLAFLISHLFLKAVHLPALAASFQEVTHAFLSGYRQTSTSTIVTEVSELVETVACLLLARVDGKSPAEYLSTSDQARVRALVLEALQASPPAVLRTWCSLE